jgi:DNA-binding GntR family transcriptional regulator
VRGRGASTVGRSRTLEEILGEHAAILDALRAGDADRAAAAMRYHLRRTGDLLAERADGRGAATRP